MTGPWKARTRSQMGRAAILFWLCLFGTEVVTRAASAQEVAQATAANQALELGHQGLTLYSEERFELALERFRGAENLAHSPVFVLYIARSQHRLGHLLEARARYESVTRESLPIDSPQAWHTAVRDAKRELEQLVPLIPSFRLVVQGAPPKPLSFKLDGELQSDSSVESPISVNPGTHTVTLSDARGRELSQELVLAIGQQGEPVVFSFPKLKPEQGLQAPKGAPSSVTQPSSLSLDAPPSDTLPTERSSLSWPAWTAFGVGAAGLGFGAVTGYMAWDRARDIRDRCVGNSCLVSDRDEGQEARRYADMATVGLAVAVVGAGVGVGFWVWGGEDDASLSFRFSPTGVSVSGHL